MILCDGTNAQKVYYSRIFLLSYLGDLPYNPLINNLKYSWRKKSITFISL